MRHTSMILAVVLVLTSCFSIVKGSGDEITDPSELDMDPDVDLQDKKRISSRLMSNYFIENRGQIPEEDHLFYSTSGDIHFLPDGVLMRFRDLDPIYDDEEMFPLQGPIDKRTPTSYHERGVVLKYSFVGSNEVIPYGRERCSWNTNYFKGSDPDYWFKEIPNYKEIIYPEVWDDIDIIYRIIEGKIKYDIILKPWADPENIRFNIDGAEKLSVNQNEDLVIKTELGNILDSGLFVYYDDENNKEIDANFNIINSKSFQFNLPNYNSKKRVTIDPLTYSTFIGGSGDDWGEDIFTDDSGNAYVIGVTYDTVNDYPTTTGAYDTTHNGGLFDIFVTKLDRYGSSLLYSTFLGGLGDDFGKGIQVDASGNAYITGYTNENFPTTSGAYDRNNNGEEDIIVTKLNSNGSSLLFSTLIGGSGKDQSTAIQIDASGNAYITGKSNSDYPTTQNAYNINHNGGYYDAFVTKLNSIGTSLLYSTFIGGSGQDEGTDIKIDMTGKAYVTGNIDKDSTDYPTTSGAFDKSHNGATDVIVTILNSSGSSLSYSTFVGGSNNEIVKGIEIDSDGNVFFTGFCGKGYPTTFGAYDTTHNGGSDVFVTKFNPVNSFLSYSTFIGGDSNDYSEDIDIDSNGNIFLTGFCGKGYPTTFGAYDRTHNGEEDVFISELNLTDSSLSYSTLIGGSDSEISYSIKLGLKGNIYITGGTRDASTNYPITFEAYDKSHNGAGDVFVTNFYIDNSSPNFISDTTPKSGTTGESITFNVTINDDYGVFNSYVEYWFGRGSHTNTSMSGQGPYTYSIHVPQYSIDTLHYIFHAIDHSGNWATSLQSNVTILDNDPPYFGVDNSKETGTIGDPYIFSTSVSDNIQISSVSVEYWFGSGDHKNVSMEGSDTYSYQIRIPEDSLDTLHYLYHALDSSDNYVCTSLASVHILDNDKPILIEDLSDEFGSTGDEFEFKVIPDDNIGVGEVTVEYWFGEYGGHENITIKGENEFTHTIVIPSDSVLDLNYMFHFNDTSNNWNQTVSKAISITDNDKPVFIEDLSPSDTTTGSDCTISIEIQDNIGIDTVVMEYWFGTGDKQEEEMSRIVNVYEFKISVPSDSTLPLNYVITASDSSGNTNSTEERRIPVIDDISPEIEHIGDLTVYQGDEIQVQVEATDNIEISDYIWKGNPVSFSGDSLSGIASDPGIYYVNVTVIDENGNKASVSFKITVLPEDHDSDHDGIPDLIEKELGLDMNSSSDASLDPDGDDLTNLEEYLNGTDINDNDTDGDGMPDGWEVDNDLDPLTPSADNDADDDGLTDLDEYLGGTDPNVFNEKEIQPTDDEPDGKSNLWIFVVIIIILVILIAVVVVVASIIKKRGSQEDQKKSDPIDKEEGSIPDGIDPESEFDEKE